MMWSSVMFTVGVSGIWGATVQQMDVLYEDFDRDWKDTRTQACVRIKSLRHAKTTCTHAYTQTYRRAGVAEREQVVWWGRMAETTGLQVEYMCENSVTQIFVIFQFKWRIKWLLCGLGKYYSL